MDNNTENELGVTYVADHIRRLMPDGAASPDCEGENVKVVLECSYLAEMEGRAFLMEVAAREHQRLRGMVESAIIASREGALSPETHPALLKAIMNAGAEGRKRELLRKLLLEVMSMLEDTWGERGDNMPTGFLSFMIRARKATEEAR